MIDPGRRSFHRLPAGSDFIASGERYQVLVMLFDTVFSTGYAGTSLKTYDTHSQSNPLPSTLPP